MHIKIFNEMFILVANFVVIGPEDYVRCFYCGGGLNKWKQEDNVWKEHAQWFSYCGFVNLVQGSQFVKRCIDNRPSLNSLVYIYNS